MDESRNDPRESAEAPLCSPELQHFLEHSSIPLAVFQQAGNGFRTHIVSDGMSAMYEMPREGMLAMLNSENPFPNVPEKEIPELWQAVRAFSQKDVPLNIVFHVYTARNRRLITVHGTGTHEFTDDGRRYSIMRYEQLSDAALSVLFADERREQQAREKLLNEITSVIADSYSSIIYVDGED
nr:hypothetical protein [Desulfovibrio sp.]